MFVGREKNKSVSEGGPNTWLGAWLDEVSLPFVTSQGVDFPDSLLERRACEGIDGLVVVISVN